MIAARLIAAPLCLALAGCFAGDAIAQPADDLADAGQLAPQGYLSTGDGVTLRFACSRLVDRWLRQVERRSALQTPDHLVMYVLQPVLAVQAELARTSRPDAPVEIIPDAGPANRTTPGPTMEARSELLMRWIPLVLLGMVLGSSPAGAQTAVRPPTDEARTFVIVHGAWGGGWAFREVEKRLRALGHTVYRPTLTGLGERSHLATPDIDLSTHIVDVVNVLRFEELEDVVLVGHSYGGMVITGVADRVPERIAQLIYLDAFLPESGESVYTSRGQTAPASREWERDGFIVPGWLQLGQAPPSDVPHPARTFAEELVLQNPDAQRIPASYILTVDPGATTDPFDPFAERARARGWVVEVMEADHNPQWSAPGPLVELLVTIEGRPTRN